MFREGCLVGHGGSSDRGVGGGGYISVGVDDGGLRDGDVGLGHGDIAGGSGCGVAGGVGRRNGVDDGSLAFAVSVQVTSTAGGCGSG